MDNNRLAREASPHLLQHAKNPVDWYPWGQEAFEKARQEDKPIFLSIGYATSHACQTMTREVFNEPGIADKMNATFVNVKVDAEELPVIYGVYQELAESMMGGPVDWPLHLVLTHNLEPFFATGFIPPHSGQGRMGMEDFIAQISELWVGEERVRVSLQAEKIVQAFEVSSIYVGQEMLGLESILNYGELFFKMTDPVHGGLTELPKECIPYQATFFLRYFWQYKDSRALYCAEKLLQSMAKGGIFDHVAGGFHAASNDAEWRVPRFEKLLPTNCLAVDSYLEAWQYLKNPLYRETAEACIAYLLDELRMEKGAFYSGQSAETDGREGLHYTWTPQEIDAAVPGEDGQLFREYYGVLPEGNFEGRSVLYCREPADSWGLSRGLSAADLSKRLQGVRGRLKLSRKKAGKVDTDTLIVSGWNGLAIHSFAYAGWILEKPEYTRIAEEAVSCIRKTLIQGGRLLHTLGGARASNEAPLEGYAFLIRGLIRLYECTENLGYLDLARELSAVLESDFKVDGGAFYRSAQGVPDLVLRRSHFVDANEPSGNAVHVENLLHLYQITGEGLYQEQAEEVLRALSVNMEPMSTHYCYQLMSVMRNLDTFRPTFVVALNASHDLKKDLKHLFAMHYMPHSAICWLHREGDALPQLKRFSAVDGKTSLYILRQGDIEGPISEFSKMQQVLEELI